MTNEQILALAKECFYSRDLWDNKVLEFARRLMAEQGEPVALIKRNAAGQIHMTDAAGESFDMSRYVGAALYASPPQDAPDSITLPRSILSKGPVYLEIGTLKMNSRSLLDAIAALSGEEGKNV